jgi:hypothetical protein
VFECFENSLCMLGVPNKPTRVTPSNSGLSDVNHVLRLMFRLPDVNAQSATHLVNDKIQITAGYCLAF